MSSLSRIRIAIALVVSAALVVVSASACQRKVEVQSGTRTVCTAGEVISDDVKTIKVPADKAGAYRVRTVEITCDKHANLGRLYAEAQTALAAKDFATAAAKLAEITAIEPTYRKAQEQADSIAKGGKPAPDSQPAPTPPPATPGTPEPPGETPTATPTGLARWAPDAITGFAAAKPLSDALSISREYTPQGDSAASSLVIVAEQYRTSDDAKAALNTQVKRLYTKDSAAIKVKGRDAYFGTDGSRFAVIGFTDGSVMVALELTTAKSPKNLRALAEQIAAQLP